MDQRKDQKTRYVTTYESINEGFKGTRNKNASHLNFASDWLVDGQSISGLAFSSRPKWPHHIRQHSFESSQENKSEQAKRNRIGPGSVIIYENHARIKHLNGAPI